jgi:ubiquinone/menaquinone biosynthesis C-methylase UbiE
MFKNRILSPDVPAANGSGLALDAQTQRAWDERVARNHKRWQQGLRGEVAFWDKYLATRGGAWHADFAERLDPNVPLQPYLEALIAAPDGTPVRILDVGAGPLTYVGRCSARWPIELVAVDPLAVAYNMLLAKHGVAAPVRTRPCAAEALRHRFGDNSFDLVSARNAIDHAVDPFCTILQMVAVVRPGCAVFLHHQLNEAIRQGYHGLHQWNFGAQGGDFILSSRTDQINVTRALAAHATVQTKTYGLEWIVNTIVKHPEPAA